MVTSIDHVDIQVVISRYVVIDMKDSVRLTKNWVNWKQQSIVLNWYKKIQNTKKNMSAELQVFEVTSYNKVIEDGELVYLVLSTYV